MEQNLPDNYDRDRRNRVFLSRAAFPPIARSGDFIAGSAGGSNGRAVSLSAFGELAADLCSDRERCSAP
jgi:hypothetical protein